MQAALAGMPAEALQRTLGDEPDLLAAAARMTRITYRAPRLQADGE
jgi:hypothetical protein